MVFGIKLVLTTILYRVFVQYRLTTYEFWTSREPAKKLQFFVFAPTDILRVNYLIDHLTADRHSHIHLVLLNMGFKNM